jgi:hypothetical protein
VAPLVYATTRCRSDLRIGLRINGYQHVRPPKECPIKLKECPANHITLRNWIAIRGDLVGPERERYDKKVTQLRQTDPQVDWSNVNSREGSRRVILFLDQDIVD